jgi:sulfite exporter TauE/SafE
MNLLLQAFILGITYGFGPCMLSCAPVLVPILISTSKGAKHAFFHTLLFSLGRIAVYVLLGGIMGALGRVLNITIPSWLIGGFMIVLGIGVMLRIQQKCFMSKIRITGGFMAFVAGVVMGFSPCAPMVAALALAISAKSLIKGALIALVFGIGTVISPILLIGLLAGRWARVKEFKGVNHWVAGGFLIVMGLLWLFQ